jgi:hypothetical protein
MPERAVPGTQPRGPLTDLVVAMSTGRPSATDAEVARLIAQRIPSDRIRSLFGCLGAFTTFGETPAGAAVKKGDVIEAQALVSDDPIFARSKIVILGVDPRSQSIVGTSFDPEHAAFLFRGTWSVDRIAEEFEAGAWKKSGQVTSETIEEHVVQTLKG